ncbi:MAG: catalase [Acidobacteriaceae bacterium]|nr:catalase [Acidobacteriaceae bacterium]
MEGFGVHTFRLVNARGKSTFVKFHWKQRHAAFSPGPPTQLHSVTFLASATSTIRPLPKS